MAVISGKEAGTPHHGGCEVLVGPFGGPPVTDSELVERCGGVGWLFGDIDDWRL